MFFFVLLSGSSSFVGFIGFYPGLKTRSYLPIVGRVSAMWNGLIGTDT